MKPVASFDKSLEKFTSCVHSAEIFGSNRTENPGD